MDSQIAIARQVAQDDPLLSIVRESLQCGICYSIVSEERNPVECYNCRNQVYCMSCLENWVKQSPSCPYCNQKSPFVSVSPLFQGLLREIKFCCKYQDKGCTEIFPTVNKQIQQHEVTECKQRVHSSLKLCQFCRKWSDNLGEAPESSEKEHYCFKIDEKYCPDHRKTKVQITEDRIVGEESKKIASLFKCGICDHLVCHPYTCICNENFCRHCISNYLQTNKHCPKCFVVNPRVKMMSKKLKSILDMITLYCDQAANGCKVEQNYTKMITSHSMECTQCDDCKEIRQEESNLNPIVNKPNPSVVKASRRQETAELDLAFDLTRIREAEEALLNAERRKRRQPQQEASLDSQPETYLQGLSRRLRMLQGTESYYALVALMYDFLLQNTMLWALWGYVLSEQNFHNTQCFKTVMAYICMFTSATIVSQVGSSMCFNHTKGFSWSTQAMISGLSIFNLHCLVLAFTSLGDRVNLQTGSFKTNYVARSVVQLILLISLITILLLQARAHSLMRLSLLCLFQLPIYNLFLIGHFNKVS